MPSTGYLIAGVVVAGAITLALRTLPFAALKPLRKSKFVQALGQWMPAGILVILAIVVLRDQLASQQGRVWPVLVATGITIVVHLLSKRRALVSIGAGTACYVLLLNFL